MTNNPFFSITIPAYNRAYILDETLESIRKQTFENWEVIIVDDGSKDNTSDIAAKLGEIDARIRYVYQDNSERSAARNNGATHARGRYLLFLDSDDAFTSEHLAEIYNLLENKQFPVCMVFSNLNYLTDSGITTPQLPVMKEGEEFRYVLMQPITPSRVCIHRDIFKTFQFDPQIVIVEDLVLWVCIATEFSVFQITKHTVNYRIHDGNSVDLSQNSYHSRYKGLQRLFTDSFYSKVSAKIPTQIKSHLLAECSFNMARHFEYVKQFKQMNKMLFLSFRHLPSYRNKERAYMFLSRFFLTSSMMKLSAKNG